MERLLRFVPKKDTLARVAYRTVTGQFLPRLCRHHKSVRGVLPFRTPAAPQRRPFTSSSSYIWSLRLRLSPIDSARLRCGVPLSRSQQMARIKGKNTRPEFLLRKALWRSGLRYRLHMKTPAGRPDLVFPTSKTAVFVDGCQWHGCPEHYVRPRTRGDFWSDKLRTNVMRDRRQTLELRRLRWQVVRVWEHQVFEELERVVELVTCAVNGKNFGEPTDQWRVVRVEPVDRDGSLERRYMESLLSADISQVAERVRSTKKWRRSR